MIERVERTCANCGEVRRCVKGNRVCDPCAAKIAAAIAEQYRGVLRDPRPRHPSAREAIHDTKYGGDHESNGSRC